MIKNFIIFSLVFLFSVSNISAEDNNLQPKNENISTENNNLQTKNENISTEDNNYKKQKNENISTEDNNLKTKNEIIKVPVWKPALLILSPILLLGIFFLIDRFPIINPIINRVISFIIIHIALLTFFPFERFIWGDRKIIGTIKLTFLIIPIILSYSGKLTRGDNTEGDNIDNFNKYDFVFGLSIMAFCIHHIVDIIGILFKCKFVFGKKVELVY